MKNALVVLLVLVGTTTLGCSPGDSPPAPTAATTTDGGGTGAEQATSGVITPADVPDIPRFDGRSRGVIGDVEVETCDTEPGAVRAAGTATNSAEVVRDVVVVISWTVGETGDVVARGVASLDDLAPGRSATWGVEASVPGAEAATCVTTALAGRVA